MYKASNEAKDCDNCKFLRKSKTQCGTCLIPDLWDENMIAVLSLFTSSQTQLRTTFGAIVGFDYLAVRQVAEWIGIDLTDDMFLDFRVMEDEFLAIARETKDGST